MYWVTSSLLGGDIRYNSILLISDRLSKTTLFLPCHKDDTSMGEALLIWNRFVSWTGIFTKIISDRNPKFTLELCTNLYQLYGTKLSFPTAYNSQTDCLSERMIQTLEDMVIGLGAYGLELRDSDGFTHNWCTLLPALELAYIKSIHSSTNKTPAIPEKDGIPE
ncbi:hypothetical protein O181_040121 [Austropuccinia psidii MF-1]|uniref:Integrase catalytic domain-containing protein n=1 Tax=Austropuccinia psidii MF-1 TaxID=1389203 RepID=A0A9Q3DH69_9BASI|nr:hypothetical protein [Austropuccinia psidii MF-1]